jgi:hypothetical protein
VTTCATRDRHGGDVVAGPAVQQIRTAIAYPPGPTISMASDGTRLLARFYDECRRDVPITDVARSEYRVRT